MFNSNNIRKVVIVFTGTGGTERPCYTRFHNQRERILEKAKMEDHECKAKDECTIRHKGILFYVSQSHGQFIFRLKPEILASP